jgi:hypothetical protein
MGRHVIASSFNSSSHVYDASGSMDSVGMMADTVAPFCLVLVADGSALRH